MKNIEYFNNILNKSDTSRHAKWSKYRDNLTKYVTTELSKEKNYNLLVIGAGNSDDLDLKILESFVDRMTISDIDFEALKSTFKKYTLDPKKSFIKKVDYIGLNKSNEWNSFVNNIVTMKSADEINKYLGIIKASISHYKFLNDERYNLIIISPIYTQLFLNQSFSYLNMLSNMNFPIDMINYLEGEFLEITSQIIINFNNNIIDLANANSELIVMSDIFEADYKSDFYRKVINTGNLDVILSEYQTEYGVGLGDFGLIHLNDKLELKSSTWFEWPFNETKCLFVKVNKYNKK